MKRIILTTINFIVFMAMLTFVALLDSDNYMPYLIGFLLCVVWFMLFCYANNYFYHNDRQVNMDGIHRGSSPLLPLVFLYFDGVTFAPMFVFLAYGELWDYSTVPTFLFCNIKFKLSLFGLKESLNLIGSRLLFYNIIIKK